MARLVESSDDEFPDLAALICKQGTGAKLQATKRNQIKMPIANAVQNQEMVKPSTRLHNPEVNISADNLSQFRKKSESCKPRRRVLNKILDNALLGPFDPTNESKLSASPATNPRSIPQVVPTMLSLQEDCRASDASRMSSFSEEKEIWMSDSTGLSDFIVNDSSYLEEDEEEEKEDSTEDDMQPCPPRPTRRLVKGRRLPGTGSSEERQQSRGNHIHLQESLIIPPLTSNPSIAESVERNLQKMWKNSNPHNGLALQLLDQRTTTELDEPLASQSIPPSETDSLDMIPRRVSFLTPPTSPQKTQKRLMSPKKSLRIPLTPHRSSTDAFWDPDVINEWNEEHSPRKTPKARSLLVDDGFEVGLPTLPNKKSQSTWDRKASEARKAFAQKKNEIAETFLQELDELITDGKIFEMAALTGGIKIIWSKKLNTTAGRANWKRETMRSTTLGTDGKQETKITYHHYASIELAEKVIDDEERLLNVIAHEFCHLANFMVSGIRNNPHGKEFKSWALKCSQQFGNRGIHVTTKHSYDIDYKYIWECVNCGTEFKRHSKSIDPLKHQCGSCKSKLVQTKPVPRANVRTNDYQLFIKENMKKVKEQNPGIPQKQVMTLVGKMYQEHKASKLGTEAEKVVPGSRDESPNDSQVDLVMRKLNFLDLRSP